MLPFVTLSFQVHLTFKNNPCRCPKKAKALKQMGMLDESKMQFNIETKTRIGDFVAEEYQNVRNSFEDKFTALFREHPAKDKFDKETVVSEIIKDDDLMRYFNVN